MKRDAAAGGDALRRRRGDPAVGAGRGGDRECPHRVRGEAGADRVVGPNVGELVGGPGADTDAVDEHVGDVVAGLGADREGDAAAGGDALRDRRGDPAVGAGRGGDGERALALRRKGGTDRVVRLDIRELIGGGRPNADVVDLHIGDVVTSVGVDRESDAAAGGDDLLLQRVDPAVVSSRGSDGERLRRRRVTCRSRRHLRRRPSRLPSRSRAQEKNRTHDKEGREHHVDVRRAWRFHDHTPESACLA